MFNNLSKPLPRIVCQQNVVGSSPWSAWREDNPFRRTGGDHPTSALRRFLEFNVPEELAFEFECDHDLVRNGQTQCRMQWAPPDLLLECPECHGCGIYTGLLEVESCRECDGKGSVRIVC